MKTLLVVALLALSALAHADNENAARITPCNASVMLAHKAYMTATFDAKYPDRKRLHYMVDYWGDMFVLPHDRKISHRGVDYIAERLRASGFRQPPDGVAYEAAREFAVKECL